MASRFRYRNAAIPSPFGIPRIDAVALVLLAINGVWLLAGVPTPPVFLPLLIALSLSILSPTAALALVMLAVPFAYWSVPLGSARFSVLELAIGFVFTSYGARLLVGWRALSTADIARQVIQPISVVAPVVALLLVASLSILTIGDPTHMRESLREYRLVIVEPLVFFCIARLAMRDVAVRRLMIVSFLSMGLVISAVAIGQFVTETNVVHAEGVDRSRATYPHPNNLALYLERVAILASGLGYAYGRGRPLAIIVAVVTSVGVAATLSRGAMLGMTIGWVSLLYLRRSVRWWLPLPLAGVAAVTLVALAGDRLSSVGGTGQLPTRLLIWQSSLAMALDRPIVGVGLDQFLYQYWPRYVLPAGWPERFTSHPHNLILDIWLRLGVLGVMVFAWLSFAVTRVVRSTPKGRVISRRPVALGAVAALVTSVTHGMVDNAYFLPDLAVMTWLLIGLIETE